MFVNLQMFVNLPMSVNLQMFMNLQMFVNFQMSVNLQILVNLPCSRPLHGIRKLDLGRGVVRCLYEKHKDLSTPTWEPAGPGPRSLVSLGSPDAT